MWLTNSSIGRKFIMALTGACLVLFVTFHVVMNAVCILWPAAYNQVCMFLGANWYALIASAGLGLLVIIHIIYAICLTVQNRKARGTNRYEVNTLPPHVEWSSKNMLVLGFVILVFLVIHLVNFWSKMQLQELLGTTAQVCVGNDTCVVAPPEFGTLFIQATFSQWYWVVLYIIGFVALWFHLNHGFWSMFQSTGWNGRIWLPRLKCIGCWWTSIVVGLFVLEAVVFCIQANKNYYFENIDLQNQYAEYFGEKAEEAQNKLNDVQAEIQALPEDQQMARFIEAVKTIVPEVEAVVNSSKALCPDASNQKLQEAEQFVGQANQFIQQMEMQMQMQQAQPAQPAPEDAMTIEGDAEIIESTDSIQN